MDSDMRNPAQSNKSYALSGRIMLSAIVILFFVVIMMVCLHLYARWYLLNARRRQIRRARNRRPHLVFYVDPSNPTAAHFAVPSRGLDSNVLKSLPMFVYSSNTHPDSIECAVCLSEFEENETGRTLPKCNHNFHIECIDMWFHSHSTCPLCRSPVEAVLENPVQAGASAEINETGTRSGLCSTCHHEEDQVGASTSSFGSRRKPFGVTIEVPIRNGNLEDESVTESPAYRSPMTRMLSFRRILSRERRGNASPSTGIQAASCELDIERGETQQTQGKMGCDSAAG